MQYVFKARNFNGVERQGSSRREGSLSQRRLGSDKQSHLSRADLPRRVLFFLSGRRYHIAFPEGIVSTVT